MKFSYIYIYFFQILFSYILLQNIEYSSLCYTMDHFSLYIFLYRLYMVIYICISVQFSCSVVSDSLRPHESQHARPPCPSPTPRVHLDCSNEIKRRLLLGRKVMTNLDSIFKSRDIICQQRSV